MQKEIAMLKKEILEQAETIKRSEQLNIDKDYSNKMLEQRIVEEEQSFKKQSQYYLIEKQELKKEKEELKKEN